MRNLALVACFIVGVGLGIGLSERPRDPEPPASPSTASRTDEPSASRDAPIAHSAAEPEDPSTATEATDVLNRFPVATYERGSGTIRGTVRTTEHIGVEGVEVTAVIWGRTPGAPSLDVATVPIEQYIRAQIDQYHYDRAVMCRATTDADGAFVIEGIRDDAQYRIDARKADWCIPSPTASQHIDAGADVALTAYPTVPVTVSVDDPGGDPVYFGWLRLRSVGELDQYDSRTFTVPWRREAPTIDVPLGWAFAYFDSRLGRRSDVQAIGLEASQPSQLEFELRAQRGVRGEIHVPGDQPVPYFQVSFFRDDGSEEPERKLAGVTALRMGVARFSVPDLEPGRYVFQLQFGFDDETGIREVVDITDSIESVRFDVPPVDRSAYVVVNVLGPDGNAVRDCGFSVSSVSRSEDRSTSAIFSNDYWKRHTSAMGEHLHQFRIDIDREVFDIDRAMSGSDEINASVRRLGQGRYAVGLGDGQEFLLHCSSKQYGDRDVTVPASNAPSCEVRFAEPCFVVVSVSGDDPGECQVNVLSDVAGGDARDLMGQSQVTLGPLAPGPATVSLRLGVDAQSDQEFAIASREVDLVSGVNSVTIEKPDLYRLTVIVDPIAVGQELTLQQTDDSDGRRAYRFDRIGSNGIVEFEHLLPGVYRVLTRRHYIAEAVVTVRRDQELRLRPERVNGLRVTITDPEGPLAQCGFEDGDWITAVPGYSFDELDPQNWPYVIFCGTTVAVAVERGGVALTIKIKRDGCSDAGGSIEPAHR